jgi:hypothetical protein
MNCNRDASKWFPVPWEFSEPLQKTLKSLAASIPEQGDNGEKANASGDHAIDAPTVIHDEFSDEVSDSGGSLLDADPLPSGDPDADSPLPVAQLGHTRPETPVGTSPDHLVDANQEQLEGPGFDAALQISRQRETAGAVIELQQVLHEMQDVVEARSTERTLNDALKKKHDAMVCLPSTDNELIWKARLVSQLNGNPFLSKDRLQRVKGEGNQYYSAEELRRLRDDNSVTTLCSGLDVAVLFEGARPTSGCAASSTVGRRGDRAVDVHQRTSAKAFIEIGRIQVIRRKNGRKHSLVKEIIDMENPGSCVEIYCYWYTCRDVCRFTKFKYDGLDKCWVPLESVIQVVNLSFAPRSNQSTLDATDSVNLTEYLKLHGKA